MEIIDAETLAFLMEIDKDTANKKIVAYLERREGNRNDFIPASIIGDKAKYSDNQSCDIEGLSKYLNIDLTFAIENIQRTYISSPATRGYILNFPAKKLMPNKITRKWPRKVSLPKVLGKILSMEDQMAIVKMWEDKYYTSIPGDPVNDVRFTIR